MLNTVINRNEISNHFEAFFEYATMGILITDSNGNITAINPFALKEFGYTGKELIGKKIEVLIPARFHKKHIQHREKYSIKNQSRPMGAVMNLLAAKKNGTEFPVEISLGNYHNNGDKYVIAFISNISMRKKAEADIEMINNKLETTVELRTRDLKGTLHQLEISAKKLEKATSFQKAILDNVGAMIITGDKYGIIQTFNPEAEKELGYSADELVNIHNALIFHDPSEVSRRAIEFSKELQISIPDGVEVFLIKSRLGLHNEQEWTYIRKNGTRFPVLLNITVLKNERNIAIGFLGVAINISERKKTEEDLKIALGKEKELNELKSRFVSMASHEFRTPLSTVLSSAYLIEKYATAEDQPKRITHLQRIVSSVTMLTDILNDFLSVGRIEEGKIQVRPTLFNIREFILTLIKETKNNLKKKQRIRYHHEGIPDILLDASLLKHIIMNLVSNASKFSAEASLIEIKTICHNDHIILSIIDQGIGISKEDQKHLMERFFRGANAGNIQGTGLGLHIVSKYAELLNGTVECKSELEKGTEFVITFDIKTG